MLIKFKIISIASVLVRLSIIACTTIATITIIPLINYSELWMYETFRILQQRGNTIAA